MKLIELPDTLADRIGCLIRPVLQPNHMPEDRKGPVGSDLRSRWQTVMTQLANWKRNPDQLEDEGVLASTAELVAVVENVAEVLPHQEGSTTLPWFGRATSVPPEWKWRRDLFQTIRVMPKSRA